ncbi:MAG: SMR family transporter [Ginsengibacter sp.]
MNWILLIIAGIFGSTAVWWIAGFFVCLSISMFLLYRTTQTLPIGAAYAVWTGIGAAGTIIVGILLFKEPTDF